MSLKKLDIFGVRNIRQVSMTPSRGLNFIYGANGSGKSSILEAIFLLGRASSFRSHAIKHVINHGAQDLVVSGQALQKNGLYAQLGIKLNVKSCDIHINHQKNCKRADLAYALPIQLIHPLSYQLLDGAASFRREFMDWGIFNSEVAFLSLWQRYKKILLHRNALLKSKSPHKQLAVWDKELVQYALPISHYRQSYLQQLQPVFFSMARFFLDCPDLSLRYFAGWDEETALLTVLQEQFDKDYRYGFTHAGPHRADFHLMMSQYFAKDFFSRGQLKLLVLALKLAQVKLLSQQFNQIGCILIDDFSAELDHHSRAKLLQLLSDMQVQVFLTTNDMQSLGDLNQLYDLSLFQMEQGIVL